MNYTSTDARAANAVVVDAEAKTVRPANADADAYYGLGPGTNGTAAITRRAAAAPEGFTWVRSDGTPATGLNYLPGQRNPMNIPSPWSGF